jgi:hypothetical protein
MHKIAHCDAQNYSLLKRRPSYRRSLKKPLKENINHFKKWNLLTFFSFCWSFLPSWIPIHNTGVTMTVYLYLWAGGDSAQHVSWLQPDLQQDLRHETLRCVYLWAGGDSAEHMSWLQPDLQQDLRHETLRCVYICDQEVTVLNTCPDCSQTFSRIYDMKR